VSFHVHPYTIKCFIEARSADTHKRGPCVWSHFWSRLLPEITVENPTNDTFLRMGELEPWIDENFVRSVWFGMGEQVNVKMIRDKFSG
jgi:hypothetical protein